MSSQVDEFMRKSSQWQEEFKKLRSIVLSCDLLEEFKWMHPCYTINGKNVIIIHGFKEYCALLFFKGALINDSHNLLTQQTSNVQAGRQVRFTDIQQIESLQTILKEYIKSAIEIEKSGVKIQMKTTSDYEVVEEFQKKLLEMPSLKTAFESLTPGRQRAYLFYFSQPKQSTTRESRIEKNIDRILNGKGLND